ncbi:hypothetical protein BH09PAT2_BH09PAT2_01660 [soil metagenome]
MDNQQTETKVTTTATVAPEQVVRTVKTVTPPVVGHEPAQKVYQTKKAIFRTYLVIWYLLGVIEILLAFRIFLKMLGANPYSGFTNLIYTLTNPLALPFYGVFRVSVTNGAIFEWSTIVAGIVYGLLAYGIIELMQLIKPTNPTEVAQTVDTQ